MNDYREIWPNLYATLDEALDDLIDPAKLVYSNGQLTPLRFDDEKLESERPTILAALVRDICPEDAGELFPHSVGSFASFMISLAHFLKRESPQDAEAFRTQWLRELSDQYEHTINCIIESIYADRASAYAERIREELPSIRWPWTYQRELERDDNRERLKGIG